MKYSYEFKQKCVEMYRQGQYPKTPKGCNQSTFRAAIRQWSRLEECHGVTALRHPSHSVQRSPAEKYELVAQVLAGQSAESVAISNGLSSGLLYQWVRRYKMKGYQGLVNLKKGRKSGNPTMNNYPVEEPQKLNESEREELIRLRAENAVIKKEIALREQKEAAHLKAKKQLSSRNFARKDSN